MDFYTRVLGLRLVKKSVNQDDVATYHLFFGDKTGQPVEAPAYPGTKPYFLISGDYWDDREWLTQLIKLSAAELPTPKPKMPRTIKKK